MTFLQKCVKAQRCGRALHVWYAVNIMQNGVNKAWKLSSMEINGR